MESCPIDGNIIHARKLATVTINHKLFKGVPGGVDLEPPEIQLLLAKCEPWFDSVPDRKSYIRVGEQEVRVDSRRSSLRNIKKGLLLPGVRVPGVGCNTSSVTVVHHDDNLTGGRHPCTCVTVVVGGDGQAKHVGRRSSSSPCGR